jgi:molecular chaperone Hsp33
VSDLPRQRRLDPEGRSAPAGDLLVRGIDREAGLRVIAAITTDLVLEAADRHGATGVGAVALGRALTSSLLLATLTKGAERVTLQLEGDGPLGAIIVDAHVDPSEAAEARGYVLRPAAATDAPAGRCQVVAALGRHGVVNVVRDLGLKENYQGQVRLLTGEVDEDVENYLRVSEQVPSALGCDVLLDGARPVAAGGVLVQSLPGSDENAVRPAQHALRTGAVHRLLTDGERSPRRLAEAVYGKSLEFVGAQPIVFRCRCSRERVEDMLTMLTTVDIDEMIAEKGQAEVTCNFCNTRYVVERPDLERIRAQLAHGPRGNN